MEPPQKQRIRVLLFVITASTVLLFSAASMSCAEKKETENTDQNEIIIYAWTDDHYLRQMANQYSREHGTEVRIVATRVESYIRKAIEEAGQPSSSIDVMLVNNTYHLEQLVDAGAVDAAAGDAGSVDADAGNAGEAVEDVNGAAETQFEGASLPGFVPLYRTAIGFLYNPDTFSDPPRDWEEFDNWLEANPERFGFTVVGGEAGFSFIYSVYHRFFADMEDDRTAGEWKTPNEKQVNRVWEWFRENQENLLYTSSDFDAIRLLLSGRLLLAPALEHYVLSLKEYEHADTAVALYVPEFGTLSQVYGLAVPKNAADKEEIASFLNFITTSEAQEYLAGRLHVRPVEHARSLAAEGTVRSPAALQPAAYGMWDNLSPVITTPEGFNHRWFIDSFTDGVLYR